MEEWKWFVYIIECEDSSYYTGMTWSPSHRWEQHVLEDGSKYTREHKPKQIVYIEEFQELDMARQREQQIKKWTRKKKEKLISGKWRQYWDS